MPDPNWVVVGLDNGGTTNNATVLTGDGEFLITRLVESPSRVTDGPAAALDSLAASLHSALDLTGVPLSSVRAVGFDTPGPATASGVISAKGATNFAHPDWRGFDYRGALEQRLGLPVFYSNDGNAAALYAHDLFFEKQALERSSVSAIVGTGLGAGIVADGRVIVGAAGMAGELGHVHIPLDGLLEPGQQVPGCNCGLRGDVESVASLTAIKNSLLPYWLGRYPDHPLVGLDPDTAAKKVRGLAEAGDELALAIFRQQAMALGRLFTLAGNFIDPHAYFVGGGVVETAPHFRDWFVSVVQQNTELRPEQKEFVQFALVPDRDMAGARGAALAARAMLLLA